MTAVVEEDENLLSGTVHRQVLVVVKREYRMLPDYLKMEINLSWGRLSRGRTINRLCWRDQTILLLTLNPSAAQVGSILDEDSLSEAFASAGDIGRVSADPFELRLARKLMSKHGKRVS